MNFHGKDIKIFAANSVPQVAEQIARHLLSLIHISGGAACRLPYSRTGGKTGNRPRGDDGGGFPGGAPGLFGAGAVRRLSLIHI